MYLENKNMFASKKYLKLIFFNFLCLILLNFIQLLKIIIPTLLIKLNK